MVQQGLSWQFTKVYDWKNYVIPARPSPSELALVEGELKRLQKKKQVLRVAILGSTVEFRSLCHRLQLEVTIIEFSRHHYDILSQQPMAFQGTERFREEDWRTMATAQKYDAMLGDLVLNVGSVKDIPRILQNISRSLAEDGACLLRTWVRRSDRRLSMATVIRQQKKKYPRLHFYTSCILPLYMCCYDVANDKGDYPAMIQGLLEQWKKGNITEEEYLSCYGRWKHEGTEFTIPRKDLLERLLAASFQIKSIQYGTDCFRRWAPIYVLSKKSL